MKELCLNDLLNLLDAYNPKTNMYQSLHTTVFGKDDRLVKNKM